MTVPIILPCEAMRGALTARQCLLNRGQALGAKERLGVVLGPNRGNLKQILGPLVACLDCERPRTIRAFYPEEMEEIRRVEAPAADPEKLPKPASKYSQNIPDNLKNASEGVRKAYGFS